MRIVLQRVLRASVSVQNEVIASIGPGLLLLVGVSPTDTAEHAAWLARKISSLRVFAATDGHSGFDRSVQDTGGGVLVVSQFTLFGDAHKGRRPDFTQAARPEVAEPLIARLCDELRGLGVPVRAGVFGAEMHVELVNDGPVTLILNRE